MSEQETERKGNLEWKLERRTVSQEQISSDGQWHMSFDETPDSGTSMRLSNYGLLCAPWGKGGSELECFEAFVEDCDRYVEKVRECQKAAAEHIGELRRG